MALRAQTHHEIELKFQVPSTGRAALAAEVARGSAASESTTLIAMYLDTPDRRLARANIAWRLRREGRRWVQTLKSAGPTALDRFEHEVLRPNATHDASLHLGTKVGQRLNAILHESRADGTEVVIRFQTRFKRMSRRIRTKGAVVEVAFDEGRVITGGAHQRIREVEFELVSGSTVALLALAERWRKRHGLIYDPRSKAERGDRLAQGVPYPPLRRARSPNYPAGANAVEAFGRVADDCIAQIAENAIGVIDGSPDLRVEHVHQLRVGIRRLRSALRSFRGLICEPPFELVEALRRLFATLGQVRDGDVLESGVAAALKAAGAPPIAVSGGTQVLDAAATLRADETQQMLLAWIRWRISLTETPGRVSHAEASGAGTSSSTPVAAPSPTFAHQEASPVTATVRGAAGAVASASETSIDPPDAPAVSQPVDKILRAPPNLARQAQKRLRRENERLRADSRAFETLGEVALHALRKRAKRQRYAVEFFEPILRGKEAKRYLKELAVVQERMGELNDLIVARARYHQIVATDPAAWFAIGWIAARIAEVRALTKPALEKLAKTQLPRALRSATA